MEKRLTVIVVNYNVRFFLEQCLLSAIEAAKEVECEIVVVDNNSSDGSVEMVEDRFPEVHLIANKNNVGFSKANNQALRISKADYSVLLNPDTVVERDTFKKCVDFMDAHPDVGGLGVKMVDGKGIFLPESKRGLPTPFVAFTKIFGLSSLFPRSRVFAQYHQGFLDENETHDVDILAGAYMLMRNQVLEEVGLLDEDFFMYGEDIDLSWRIRLGGYRNVYFPETRIIHYKGESTKKSSVNYVFVFYQAMIIFARKHFSKSNAGLFSFFINLAIYFRASIAILRRFFDSVAIPLLDAALIFGSFYGVKAIYQEYSDKTYPDEWLPMALGAGALIMTTGMWLNGAYDRPVKLFKVIKGALIGGLTLLLVYSLLPESMRFSRAIVLLGALAGFAAVTSLRVLGRLFGVAPLTWQSEDEKRIAIVGTKEENLRVLQLLKESGVNHSFHVEVRPDNHFKNKEDHFVGRIGQLQELIDAFNLNEVIFCSSDVGAEQIIRQMSTQRSQEVEYKIAPPGSSFIIGSNSVNGTGTYYSVVELNNITTAENRRNKRLLDLLLGVILLLGSPLLLFGYKNKGRFVKNLIDVVTGRKSFVSFCKTEKQNILLPKLKPSILDCQLSNVEENNLSQNRDNSNIYYAQNYSIALDFKLIWQKRSKLDN